MVCTLATALLFFRFKFVIFEYVFPAQKVSATYKKRAPGLGVGLHIAKYKDHDTMH